MGVVRRRRQRRCGIAEEPLAPVRITHEVVWRSELGWTHQR